MEQLNNATCSALIYPQVTFQLFFYLFYQSFDAAFNFIASSRTISVFTDILFLSEQAKRHYYKKFIKCNFNRNGRNRNDKTSILKSTQIPLIQNLIKNYFLPKINRINKMRNTCSGML